MSPAPPLIVTLTLDPATFAVVDALRRRHFPPDRNHLSAHVTLFHSLPGEHEATVVEQLARACAAVASLSLTLPSVRFLGRGVAVDVACPGLNALRADLAGMWETWLTPQDRQGFRPHVTVQNKVDPAVAKALYERLRTPWTPIGGEGTGLRLSRYLGGPWEPVGTFPFGAAQPSTISRTAAGPA